MRDESRRFTESAKTSAQGYNAASPEVHSLLSETPHVTSLASSRLTALLRLFWHRFPVEPVDSQQNFLSDNTITVSQSEAWPHVLAFFIQAPRVRRVVVDSRPPEISAMLASKRTALGTMHHTSRPLESAFPLLTTSRPLCILSTYVLSQITRSLASYHGTLTVYLSCVACAMSFSMSSFDFSGDTFTT